MMGADVLTLFDQKHDDRYTGYYRMTNRHKTKKPDKKYAIVPGISWANIATADRTMRHKGLQRVVCRNAYMWEVEEVRDNNRLSIWWCASKEDIIDTERKANVLEEDIELLSKYL